jgi:hypothetical protein
MLEIERKVNPMVGEYTMNEYKAYKALVKHKRRINRVFSEVCGDKSFHSRHPSRKLKIPAVAVASCSAAPSRASHALILPRLVFGRFCSPLLIRKILPSDFSYICFIASLS